MIIRITDTIYSYGGADGFDKTINNELDYFLDNLESDVEKPLDIKVRKSFRIDEYKHENIIVNYSVGFF